MFEGALIAESMRTGTTLEGITLTVRKVVRRRQRETGGDLAAIWTIIDFEVAEDEADKLAEILATVLEEQGGWYADFRSEAETFVVYSNRIFRYARGDAEARAEAEAYGREHGVPDNELDWPV